MHRRISGQINRFGFGVIVGFRSAAGIRGICCPKILGFTFGGIPRTEIGYKLAPDEARTGGIRSIFLHSRGETITQPSAVEFSLAEAGEIAGQSTDAKRAIAGLLFRSRVSSWSRSKLLGESSVEASKRKSMDEQVLSHFGPDGAARMVDVGEKPLSRRSAVAQAAVFMKPETAAAIRGGTAAKGDVLQVARLAGIQASKLTSQLIPLCHIVPLDKVDVAFQWSDAVTLLVIASTSATAKTGVEMEALTAATISALTVYDMCKAIDRTMEIRSVVLLEKSGGVHGDFRRENGI